MKQDKKKYVAIHQPECLPWLGFFNKMMLADEYIILDDVQYCKRNFQNRNQIQINERKLFLTLPVKCPLNSLIKDVKISNTPFDTKHLTTIQRAYSKEEKFKEFFPLLENLYRQKHNFLLDFNMAFIASIREYLSIDTPIHFSSKFDVKSNKTQRILDLIESVSGTNYITGTVSLNYLDPDLFNQRHISLKIHTMNPSYVNKRKRQFLSHLSIIDLLMQYSPTDAKRIILQSGTSIDYKAHITDI